MRILRAPARITLLPQGSKLGYQGTAKGMKIGNVWWVRKHKQLLCEFCVHLSGSHFRRKDLLQGSKLGPQGTAKGRKMENACWVKKTETTLMCILRAPVRIALLPQGSKLGFQATAKGMKMGNIWWAKNTNDFYVNFARACQDRTFAARVQVGTPRDSQRNENWKCLMGNKT